MTQKKLETQEKARSTDVSSVEGFITKAIEGNLPVETMERLFELRSKVKAEAAKEAFLEAKASFQEQCPVIEKKKNVRNKSGSIRYKYAGLDDEIQQIKEPLSRNSLSYSWNTANKEGMMEVTCYLTHVMGYTEESSFSIPIDKNEYMTAPQRYASAQTFAKRYTLNNVLGISTAEEDVDAGDVKPEVDAQNKKSKIVFRLRKLGVDTATKEKIENSVKKNTNLQLSEKNYDEIIDRLDVIIQENQYDSSKV